MLNSFFSFRRVYAILKKEFIQLRRDKSTFAMIVIFPIIQLLLLGYAINTDPKHLSTAVYSRDDSSFSRSFLMNMKNSEYFDIGAQINSDEEANELLQKGKVLFVVNIPDGFVKKMIRGENPEILIQADATDSISVMTAVGAMEGILQSTVNQELVGNLSYLNSSKPPLNIIIHKLYNPEGFTRYNIVPGLIGIVLMFSGIMMTALALTRENERGTMENLLAMPVKPLEVMIGKIFPYMIIGYMQSFIILIIAKLLFSLPILGSFWLFSFALLIFIICNLAIGFTISAVARTQTQALQFSIMIIMPSLLLSGFMFPFLGMPKWAQIIGNAIPMTYFNRIIKGIMLKGNSFLEIWGHLEPLLLFMIIITFIAMKFYRKTLD